MKRVSREQKVWDAIRAAAEAEEVCPSNAELAELIDVRSAATASQIIARLEHEGTLQVQRRGWARVIFFNDGVHTAMPHFDIDNRDRRADRGAAPVPPAPIARTGRGVPCHRCACRADACQCRNPAFHRPPSSAASVRIGS